MKWIAVLGCGALLCYMVERSHMKDKGANTCLSTPAGDLCGQASASSNVVSDVKDEGDKIAEKAKKLAK